MVRRSGRCLFSHASAHKDLCAVTRILSAMCAATGVRLEWGELCSKIEGTFRDGLPVKAGLEEALGDAYPAHMPRRAGGNPVWEVAYADIAPAPRRSMLDHSNVARVELHNTAHRFHLLAREPVELPDPANSPGGPTDDVMQIDVSKKGVFWHHVNQNLLNNATGNIVRDIAASFRDTMILCAENAIHDCLEVVGIDKQLLPPVYTGNARESRDVKSKDVISRNDIVCAARTIVKENPHVEFPGDIVCMISPIQATHLFAEYPLDVSHGIGGIDVIVSPAVGLIQSDEPHTALVAAKGSVGVALSGLEIKIVRTDDGVGLGAQFSVGAALSPHMAVKVVSGSGGYGAV